MSLAQFTPLCDFKREDYLHCDDYFMATAVLTSKRSKGPVTQVGAVIVNEDNLIIGSGYNGFPSKCKDDEFPWYTRKYSKQQFTNIRNTNSELRHLHAKKLYVVHAEANAILNTNCGNLKNSRLYTNVFPCNDCAKLIAYTGISKVFYISQIHAEKAEYCDAVRMLKMAGVECELYKPQQKSIVLNLS